MLVPISPLIKRVKSLQMKVSQRTRMANRQNNQCLAFKLMRNNQSLNQRMHLKIIRTICNYRFRLRPETMQCTWVLYSWDHHKVSQLEQYLTQVPNTWQLPVLYAMIKPRVTLNSRNTIHFLGHLSREINLMKGARPRHTTCINLTQIKFCQKPLQS